MHYVYLHKPGKSVIHDEVLEFPTYLKAKQFAMGYVRGIEEQVNSILRKVQQEKFLIPYQAEDFDGCGYAWYAVNIIDPEDLGTIVLILFDPPRTSPSVVSLRRHG